MTRREFLYLMASVTVLALFGTSWRRRRNIIFPGRTLMIDHNLIKQQGRWLG